MRNPVASEAANQVLAKYPKASNLELARMIYKKHPLSFNSLDSARGVIRYKRGAAGAKNRERAGIKENVTPVYTLPESDAKEYPPMQFDGVSRVGILADLHFPYHTKAAIEIAVKECKRRDVDGILLNGDVCDAHTLSEFEHDPGARSWAEERKIVVQFLGWLRQEFPKARIIYRGGNHEHRHRRLVLKKCRELYDEEVTGLDHLFKMADFGIEPMFDKRIIRLGKLNTLHGDELGKSSGGSPARSAYMKAKACLIESHHHKVSEHTETSIDGGIFTVWTTGCLSELQPRYAPWAGYQHGFANVDIAKNGDFQVCNHRILGSKLLN
jgi:predicted phosphodiesterase